MNAVTTTAQASVARRPQPNDFRPLQELTVAQLLEDPRVFQAMAESAPKHLSPQRLLRVMAQCIRKTPKLAQCHPLSLLGAMITCSSLGLEPNTPLGHAYLIPFEKNKKVGSQWVLDSVEVQVILGYQGLIDLSRRTGSLVSIHADVAYDGDVFEFEYGSNQHLRHIPQGSREGRKPTYAYAHAKLEDGEAFEVLPYAEVMRVRDATQSFKAAMEAKAKGYKTWSTAPWVAYEHEMVQKTMVRRLSKWLPRSIEFASAVELDSLGDRGMIDFKAIAQEPALASDPQMAAIEDQPQQTETATTTVETATKKPEPPKPPAAKKAEPQISEQDEREADRMTRAAMEGQQNPAEATLDDGELPTDDWDDYLVKKTAEEKSAATSGIAAEVNKAFKDAIVGAMQRNEITEARANALLIEWTKHYQAPAKSNGKK